MGSVQIWHKESRNSAALRGDSLASASQQGGSGRSPVSRVVSSFHPNHHAGRSARSEPERSSPVFA